MDIENDVSRTDVPLPPFDDSAGPSYAVNCHSCGVQFDVVRANWCSCLTKERTFVCPACSRCFCRADIGYKRKFWMFAPGALWDRKQRSGREPYPLPANPEPGNVERPLILVVDDDREIIAVAARMVPSWGFGFIHAQSGTEALSLAKAFRPDVILADALMPKMDGRELCRLVKSDPDLIGTKVVIMSSVYTSGRFRREAIADFRADDYVAKPVDPNTLLQLLGSPVESGARDAGQRAPGPTPALLPIATDDPAVAAVAIPPLVPEPVVEVAGPDGTQPLASEEAAEPEPLDLLPLIIEEEIRYAGETTARLSANELIQLRAVGGDPELLAMASSFRAMSGSDLVAVAASGVPLAFLRSFDETTAARLAAADIVKLFCAGTEPRSGARLLEQGYTSDEVAGLSAAGVPAAFAHEVGTIAGRKVPIGELVRLHQTSVSIEYLRGLTAGGEPLDADAAVRLASAEVPLEYVVVAREALDHRCSTEDVLRLWLAGVEPDLLARIAGRI